MTTTQSSDDVNDSKCVICHNKLEDIYTITIIYCCYKKAHLDCWCRQMKQDKTKCYHCHYEYSKEIQSQIDQDILRKEKIERENINNIFGYIHQKLLKFKKNNNHLNVKQFNLFL